MKVGQRFYWECIVMDKGKERAETLKVIQRTLYIYPTLDDTNAGRPNGARPYLLKTARRSSGRSICLGNSTSIDAPSSLTNNKFRHREPEES